MQTVLVVLTVIVAILLIIVVLIQKSKGGGLASNFAGSNQIMGVRRTNDFIEKTTWVLAIIILVLSILSSLIGNGKEADNGEFGDQMPATEQTQPTNFGSEATEAAAAATEAPKAEAAAAAATEAAAAEAAAEAAQPEA